MPVLNRFYFQLQYIISLEVEATIFPLNNLCYTSWPEYDYKTKSISNPIRKVDTLCGSQSHQTNKEASGWA